MKQNCTEERNQHKERGENDENERKVEWKQKPRKKLQEIKES